MKNKHSSRFFKKRKVGMEDAGREKTEIDQKDQDLIPVEFYKDN
jgi:hypothetical protein